MTGKGCIRAIVLGLIVLSLAACGPKAKRYPMLSDMISDMEVAGGADKTQAPSQTQESGPLSTTPDIERIPLPSYGVKKEAGTQQPLPPPTPQQQINYELLALQKKPIMINVEGMPLNDFINFGMAETLKVNVFTDDQVRAMKNPVTLRMTRELPAPQVLEACIEILKRYNLEVEQRGGTLYIGKPKPRPPAQRPGEVSMGRTVTESPFPILQIVPLRYIPSNVVIPLINEYFKLGQGFRELSRDTIMISGSTAAIKEIISFIEVVDVPFFQNKQIFNLKLTYWAPEDFIKQMTLILNGLGISVSASAKEPGVFFLPVKFLNSVLFAAPDEPSFKLVMDWKKRLDTPQSAGTEEKLFIYRPRYSKATELVEAVRKLYGGGPVMPMGAGPGAGQPGAQPAAAPSQPQSFSGPVKAGLRMSSDDRKNLVIIGSSPAVYADLLQLFDELDKPQRQVLIEVTIAELTLKDDLKFGLEWFINNRMYDGGYTLGTLFGVGATSPGLVYSFLSDSKQFAALLNAFAQRNLINILSSPRIMALDNQEASIQVGTEVPIVTSEQSVQTTSVIQPQVLRNIQYRQTGVQLRVRPTINTEGALTLNVSQEVSESQKNAFSSIDSPMILVRRMNTTVVAETGKTIVLGGLMSETESEGESKIPFLGDIPLLGYLFKTYSTGKVKTELIVIMTPVILSSVTEAVDLTEEMKKALKWYWQGEIKR